MSPRKRSKRTPKPKEVAAVNGDDDFWSHGVWDEDESDHEFDEADQSDDGEDIVDSDFDASEPDSDGGAETAARKPAASSKRRRNGKYVDPALKKPKPRAAAGSTAAPAAKRAKRGSAEATPAAERASLRNSTKATRAKADSLREKADAERAVRRAKVKESQEGKKPEKVLTQKEMLEEAKGTAEGNEVDLQRLLRLEEERKRPTGMMEVREGEKMTVKDREGKVTISFTEGADVRKEMFPQCADGETKEEQEG